MSRVFTHVDLKLVEPRFSSRLTEVIMNLQYLRKHSLGAGATTPPPIFFQLKEIFHLLESLSSARIEGNNTTIAEAVEARIENRDEATDPMLEITNMTKAMSFIEENISEGAPITRGFILELHKRTVNQLEREGDRNPGAFRLGNVAINKSTHVPPDGMQVQSYMEELDQFINAPADPKWDLLRIAIAHHRFAWIHPFGNGNGRVVRLLTYALLIAKGFNVKEGRILNPSAVLAADRQRYYAMLSAADSGEPEAMLNWSEYLLSGILVEMQKIDRLLDYTFLKSKILLPAIAKLLSRRMVTVTQGAVLRVAVEKVPFKAGDLKGTVETKHPVEVSRILKSLSKDKLIHPTGEKTRKYILAFSNSYLLRGIVEELEQQQFITLSRAGSNSSS